MTQWWSRPFCPKWRPGASCDLPFVPFSLLAFHPTGSSCDSPSLSPLPFLFSTSGGTGEVRLPAENGEPGEDMEEALVCPETGTNPVLQVSGEALPRT